MLSPATRLHPPRISGDRDAERFFIWPDARRGQWPQLGNREFPLLSASGHEIPSQSSIEADTLLILTLFFSPFPVLPCSTL